MNIKIFSCFFFVQHSSALMVTGTLTAFKLSCFKSWKLSVFSIAFNSHVKWTGNFYRTGNLFFSVYPSGLHLIYCALMLSLYISKYPTTFSLCYPPERFSPLWSHVHNTCPDIYTFYTTSYLPWNLTCKIIVASNDLIILRFSFSIWSNFVWQSLNANAELDSLISFMSSSGQYFMGNRHLKSSSWPTWHSPSLIIYDSNTWWEWDRDFIWGSIAI